MERAISFAAAMKLWKQVRQRELEDTSHLSIPELNDLARQIYRKGGNMSETEAAQHALGCPRCLHELANFFEAMEESLAWDMVLLRAASGGEQLVRFVSVYGRYTVTAWRSLSDRRKVLITVEVAPDYEQELEGKTIVVRDRNSNLLLEGTLVGGRASQEIEDIGHFDLTCMSINAKADTGDEQV